MGTTQRTTLLLFSALAAALATWVFIHAPPVLVPEPSEPVRCALNLIFKIFGFILFFAFLSPIWLPAVIPSRLGKALKFIRITSGILLLLVAVGIVVLMAAVGEISSFLSILASVFTALGSMHILGARVRVNANAA